MKHPQELASCPILPTAYCTSSTERLSLIIIADSVRIDSFLDEEPNLPDDISGLFSSRINKMMPHTVSHSQIYPYVHYTSSDRPKFDT